MEKFYESLPSIKIMDTISCEDIRIFSNEIDSGGICWQHAVYSALFLSNNYLSVWNKIFIINDDKIIGTKFPSNLDININIRLVLFILLDKIKKSINILLKIKEKNHQGTEMELGKESNVTAFCAYNFRHLCEELDVEQYFGFNKKTKENESDTEALAGGNSETLLMLIVNSYNLSNININIFYRDIKNLEDIKSINIHKNKQFIISSSTIDGGSHATSILNLRSNICFFDNNLHDIQDNGINTINLISNPSTLKDISTILQPDYFNLYNVVKVIIIDIEYSDYSIDNIIYNVILRIMNKYDVCLYEYIIFIFEILKNIKHEYEKYILHYIHSYIHRDNYYIIFPTHDSCRIDKDIIIKNKVKIFTNIYIIIFGISGGNYYKKYLKYKHKLSLINDKN
jgi:hypothetical protein